MDAHPCFDYTPANRLRFILRGSTAHRSNEWADLPGRPLEDQLAEIVQEVDLRGEAAEHNRHVDEQTQEAAQQNCESAVHKAHAAYTHTPIASSTSKNGQMPGTRSNA
jgi:hypothetical protein